MSVKQTWLQLKHMFWLARFWMTCQGTRNNDFEHDIYFKLSFKLILSILTLNLEFLHAQRRGLDVLLRLCVCKCGQNFTLSIIKSTWLPDAYEIMKYQGYYIPYLYYRFYGYRLAANLGWGKFYKQFPAPKFSDSVGSI